MDEMVKPNANEWKSSLFFCIVTNLHNRYDDGVRVAACVASGICRSRYVQKAAISDLIATNKFFYCENVAISCRKWAGELFHYTFL